MPNKHMLRGPVLPARLNGFHIASEGCLSVDPFFIVLNRGRNHRDQPRAIAEGFRAYTCLQMRPTVRFEMPGDACVASLDVQRVARSSR